MKTEVESYTTYLFLLRLLSSVHWTVPLYYPENVQIVFLSKHVNSVLLNLLSVFVLRNSMLFKLLCVFVLRNSILFKLLCVFVLRNSILLKLRCVFVLRNSILLKLLCVWIL